MKKVIVVSAVNIVEGGTLAVLKECLKYLSVNLTDKYKVVVLVNRKTLFSFKNLEYLEFPKSKKRWLNRLYYEYCHFYKVSKRLDPFLWLSFHDMTPNVKSERLAVYCHNPSPFPSLVLDDLLWGGHKYVLFKLFYRYLYACNIHKADFVILQQESLKKRFIEITGVAPNKIIISHPIVDTKIITAPLVENKNIFFYPTFPRVFKNLEVVCKASRILLKQGIDNFQVVFTISGSENRYARHIYRSYSNTKNIEFIGIQSRDRIFELYSNAKCVIFPSKLETWGMPIIETKLFLKPILLADLEYAHETLGSYDKIKFFDPDNAEQLAGLMKAVIIGTIVYENTVNDVKTEQVLQSWKEMFDVLLGSDFKRSFGHNAKAEQPNNA